MKNIGIYPKSLIGLERGMVRLDEYSLQWKDFFEKEREPLEGLLGDLIIDIYHIGSTSIPEMVAKPIIDMAVVIDDLTALNEYIKPLEAMGYMYRPQHDTSEKKLFVKGGEEHRTHYIHFYRRDSSQLRDVVLFRDYLSYNKEPAMLYSKFKRLLADRYPRNRAAYTEAKGKFISRILSIAKFEEERNISIRRASHYDFSRWSNMRRKLWPECPIEEHYQEIEEYLSIKGEEPVYMAVSKEDGTIGFLETSIRLVVSECYTYPMGYIEGWYVEEEFRRTHIGRNLVMMAEAWALSMGFSEMGSDAEVTNHVSIEAHKRLSYEEITRDEIEVKFLKNLIRD